MGKGAVVTTFEVTAAGGACRRSLESRLERFFLPFLDLLAGLLFSRYSLTLLFDASDNFTMVTSSSTGFSRPLDSSSSMSSKSDGGGVSDGEGLKDFRSFDRLPPRYRRLVWRRWWRILPSFPSLPSP